MLVIVPSQGCASQRQVIPHTYICLTALQYSICCPRQADTSKVGHPDSRWFNASRLQGTRHCGVRACTQCWCVLSGAKKQIQASNEKKRKEAAKWAEKQPKRKQKKVDSSSLKSVMPPQEAKEPSEPQKTLEFVKDLLTDKVERLYFHVFP